MRNVIYRYRYDPLLTGLFAAVAALLFWYFSALAIDRAVVPVGASFVLDIVSTLCGTAVGAFMAYFFARRIEVDKRNHEKYLNDCELLLQSNSLLIELKLMENDIANAKSEYDKKGIGEPYGFPYDGFSILTGMMCDGNLDFSKGALPKLIPKKPNLILEVSLLSSGYRACINAIHERNRFALQEVEPIIRRWKELRANADDSAIALAVLDNLESEVKGKMVDEQRLIKSVRENIEDFSNKMDLALKGLYEELKLELPEHASAIYKPFG